MGISMPTDHADAARTGSTSPTRTRGSRRETILSLVEMLLQQGDDTSKGHNPLPSFEDDHDVPTVDEHLQVVGAEAFHRFQRSVTSLDRELRNFANAARQLGSSVAILSSAFHLRERLAQILFLYHENAADLFPRKITHISRDAVVDPKRGRRGKQQKTPKNKTPPHVARPIVTENLDPERFPEQLEALAKDVITFLNCLNEFPEFMDEAVNASIVAFEGDLKYWASCLQEYTGQFRYPAVQRYIHDLSNEMGEHIDSITTTLSMFIEVGVPTIRFAQKHGATNLLNLSTVATFFSAVTATTLQFSFELERSQTADAVNCFWFASLVFSIAAAVNSLLGLTWKQAMYRSPGHRVPWWVLIWIKRSPLVFLVMSVACFSIGLCCFTYATHQAPVTSYVTTIFTTVTSFGLAAVSAWFATERWIFLHHHGEKWLSDVIKETKKGIARTPGILLIKESFRHLHRHLRAARNSVHSFRSRTIPALSHVGESTGSFDSDGHTLPGPGGLPYHQGHAHELFSRMRSADSSVPDMILAAATPQATSPISPTASDLPFADTPTMSNGRALWTRAIQRAQMRNAAAALAAATQNSFVKSSPNKPDSAKDASRQHTSSTVQAGGYGERKRTSGEEPVKCAQLSRVAALVPKLQFLQTTKSLAAHSALVRHLQFSPDGKYLATSSWDKTSTIFRVGDPTRNEPFISRHLLGHGQGFVGQVAWSPTGNSLLTKSSRGVKLWTAEDGVCQKTFDRKVCVESISWFPTGDAFISVEGSDVTKMDLNGNILDTYRFNRMKLHDVAITPDSMRLVGVGPLLESSSGLQPSKCRVEKRLVVYNMDTRTIENQTPVLNDVRDITVAQGATHALALVSYENQAPPQLWRIELVKDRDNGRDNGAQVARLTLRHTYMPKGLADFAGPSYFGGKNNELILCAGKTGDIHIWDQESGALLHHIRPQSQVGDLTCIAWNHAAEDPFMFATGSHDGTVRIWSKLAEDLAISPTSAVDEHYSHQLQVPSPFREQSTPHENNADREPTMKAESPKQLRQIDHAVGEWMASATRDKSVAFSPRAMDMV